MTPAGGTLVLALAALLWLAGCSTEVAGPATPPVGPATAGRDTTTAGQREATTAEQRDAAVRAAEQAAVALTSLDHRDPEAGYDRLLGLLTGPARQEWEQRRAEYLAMITSDVLTVELAAVEASGVVALDPAGSTATVLVAATAMVSAKQVTEPEKRHYRLRMSLVRTTAEWQVSQLQFVP